MENIIVLLAFYFLLQNIFCNDELLSKFHQNTFKIKNERLQLIWYNKSTFNFYELKAFKYNRTTTAHNITLNLKYNTYDKIEVLVQCYKFLSNEYRHFPLRFQANLKKIIDTNVIGMGAAVKSCGNIKKIYFYKNITYHFCNFVLDATHFPPLIPNGKYKVESTFLFEDEPISLHYLFGEVYVPISYPKK